MFAPGEQIRELLRTECDEYLICAPFIKVGPLKALLSCIPYGEEALVAVYTRWFAAEVAAGVTDLEVFDLCLERPGTILYLVNSLHAKLYRAGEQCLVPKAKRRSSPAMASPRPSSWGSMSGIVSAMCRPLAGCCAPRPWKMETCRRATQAHHGRLNFRNTACTW